MQICSFCGRDVKYITTGPNEIVKADSTPITIYTATGRKVEGYTLHVCNEADKETWNRQQKTEIQR